MNKDTTVITNIAKKSNLLDAKDIIGVVENPPTVCVSTLSLLRYNSLISTLKTNHKTTWLPLNMCLRVQAVEKMPPNIQFAVLDLLDRGYVSSDVQFTYQNHGSGVPRHDVVNRAINHYNADFVITLDDDIRMPMHGIETLIALLNKYPKFGAIGLWLRPWCNVWEVKGKTLVHRPPKMGLESVDAIGSATMCIRKEVFKTCNLDPEYYIGWGDMDFCAQMRQNNWEIGMFSMAGFQAINGNERSPEYTAIRHNRQHTSKSHARYTEKWGRTIIA